MAVHLKVSGKEFITSSDTLLRFPGETYFAIMLKNPPNSNGVYYIDRNSKMFAIILDYMQSGYLRLPSTMSRNHIIIELNYYRLPITDPEVDREFMSFYAEMFSMTYLEVREALGHTYIPNYHTNAGGRYNQIPRCTKTGEVCRARTYWETHGIMSFPVAPTNNTFAFNKARTVIMYFINQYMMSEHMRLQ